MSDDIHETAAMENALYAKEARRWVGISGTAAAVTLLGSALASWSFLFFVAMSFGFGAAVVFWRSFAINSQVHALKARAEQYRALTEESDLT